MFSEDPDTGVIFLNFFGGMQDGSVLSACLIDSIKRNVVKNKPIVVRLKGLSA
jgi:succinyl-CoA synthetase beta subunit